MSPSDPIYPPTNEIFHDAALDAAEQAAVFEDGWVIAGTVSQLAGPDSHFVYEAQGRSLLITRDAAGRIHAFVNACTHRGTRLCTAAGTGRIQCPYHGWVYGNDGRLLGASRRSGLPTFEPRALGLRELAAEELGGFIFVHGGAGPRAPLRAYLGDLAPHVERFGESMGTLLFQVRVPIEGNWKLAMSGSIEDYHAPFVHSRAVEEVQPGEAQTTLAPGGHSWFLLAAPLPPFLRVALPLLLGQPPRTELGSFAIFPNVSVVTLWSLLQVSNWIPIAPGRTLRATSWFAATPQPARFSGAGLRLALLADIARRLGRRHETASPSLPPPWARPAARRSDNLTSFGALRPSRSRSRETLCFVRLPSGSASRGSCGRPIWRPAIGRSTTTPRRCAPGQRSPSRRRGSAWSPCSGTPRRWRTSAGAHPRPRAAYPACALREPGVRRYDSTNSASPRRPHGPSHPAAAPVRLVPRRGGAATCRAGAALPG